MSDKTAPVTLDSGSNRANQIPLRVAQKPQRVGIQRNVRAIFLTIACHPLEEFFPFLRRLDAYTQNLYLLGNVSFRFIYEGRHLGPAPRSPSPPVKE